MAIEWIMIGELGVIAGIGLGMLKSKKPKTYDGDLIEATTRLPMNIHAQTCEHQWEEITKETLTGDFGKKLVIVLKCSKCGTIDKTIESIDTGCKHQWDEKTHTVDSPFELRYSNAGYSLHAPEPSDKNAWMFKKTKTVVRTCRNCGMSTQIEVTNVKDIKHT